MTNFTNRLSLTGNAGLTRQLVFLIFFSLSALWQPINGQPDLQPSSCQSLLAKVPLSSKKDWDNTSNIFSDSFTTYISVTTFVLLAVQSVRNYDAILHRPLEVLADPGFLITVFTDPPMTLFSFMVSLYGAKIVTRFSTLWQKGMSRLKLKKGPLLASKEPTHLPLISDATKASLTSISINTMIATSFTLLGWQAAGVSLETMIYGTPIVASFSAAAYSILQKTRNFLFKEYPFVGKTQSLNPLWLLNQDGVDRLMQAAKSRATQLEIPPPVAARMQYYLLYSLTYTKPYEVFLQNNPLWDDLPTRNPAVYSLITKITNLKEKLALPGKLSQDLLQTNRLKSLTNLRKQLVRHLLKLESGKGLTAQQQLSLQDVLNLGQPFNSQTSIQAHQTMLAYDKAYFTRLLHGSIFDQALSSGFLGGYLLYAINSWAVTGAIPWHIFGL